MLRHRSLVMIFSDLLADPDPILQALHRLRHRGHDVILFHILDEAEVHFPFDGMVEFEEPETEGKSRRRRRPASARTTSAKSTPSATLYRRECFQTGIDYVPLDTSMQFDKALLEYLVSRSTRGSAFLDAHQALARVDLFQRVVGQRPDGFIFAQVVELVVVSSSTSCGSCSWPAGRSPPRPHRSLANFVVLRGSQLYQAADDFRVVGFTRPRHSIALSCSCCTLLSAAANSVGTLIGPWRVRTRQAVKRVAQAGLVVFNQGFQLGGDARALQIEPSLGLEQHLVGRICIQAGDRFHVGHRRSNVGIRALLDLRRPRAGAR